MTKYYCAYCDVYLTHDAPRVRKDHNAGWKHAAQVRAHFLSQNQDHMTRRVGEIVKDYEERGMAVVVPATVTIGRPPVGPGPGASGMMRPPMAPMAPMGSANFRPNMPFPPMHPNQANPQYFPFPPGVRPPFPPMGMPLGMMQGMPLGMMQGMPGMPPGMPPMPMPSGMLPNGMPFPPGQFPPFNPQNMPPHMMMMPPRPPYNPNNSSSNDNKNS